MLSTESANVGSLCLICTPLEMSKWIFLPSTITEQDFVSLTLVQRSHVIMWLNFGILMIRPIKGAGGWYLNEVICICSLYHGEFPPEGPSEERREHCEVLDPQEICSKGIDPLNNSYMTDVMIIAEFLLLGERSRVQRRARRRRTDLTAKPAMKWDWSSDAKRAQTFRSYSRSLWLFWSAHVLDDYDLASVQKQNKQQQLQPVCTSIDCNESPYSVNSRS